MTTKRIDCAQERGELVHRQDRHAERDGQGCRQAASGRHREVRRNQDRQASATTGIAMAGHWYNYSQVMKTLAPCTNDTKRRLLVSSERHPARRRNECRCGFGACEGPGFQAAPMPRRSSSSSPMARRRNHSDFSPDVASSAVGYAKDMKDAGAAVYSIGIFKGADPAKYPDGAGRFQREQVHARRVEQLPVCGVFLREHELVVRANINGTSAIVRRAPMAKTPRSTRARPMPMS